MQTLPALWDDRCQDCPDKKVRIEMAKIDPRIPALQDLDLMITAGCPIPADALPRETWLALGAYRDEKAKLGWGGT